MKKYSFIFSLLITLLCLNSCKSKNTNAPAANAVDTVAAVKSDNDTQSFQDSVPKPIGWVNDYEGLFTGKEKQQLDSIISTFEKETAVEISIVTLDSSAVTSERFDEFALHIARTWGVGKKDKNNGVLICFSQALRKIRICNGYGIEKILSNDGTKDIIDKYFIPAFTQSEYFKGTLDGLLALISTLRGKL